MGGRRIGRHNIERTPSAQVNNEKTMFRSSCLLFFFTTYGHHSHRHTHPHLFIHCIYHRHSLVALFIYLPFLQFVPTEVMAQIRPEQFPATNRWDFIWNHLIPQQTPVLEDPFCPICIEDYNRGSHAPCQVAGTSGCRHTFCRACIVEHTRESDLRLYYCCPQCRGRWFQKNTEQSSALDLAYVPEEEWEAIYEHREQAESARTEQTAQRQNPFGSLSAEVGREQLRRLGLDIRRTVSTPVGRHHPAHRVLGTRTIHTLRQVNERRQHMPISTPSRTPVDLPLPQENNQPSHFPALSRQPLFPPPNPPNTPVLPNISRLRAHEPARGSLDSPESNWLTPHPISAPLRSTGYNTHVESALDTTLRCAQAMHNASLPDHPEIVLRNQAYVNSYHEEAQRLLENDRFGEFPCRDEDVFYSSNQLLRSMHSLGLEGSYENVQGGLQSAGRTPAWRLQRSRNWREDTQNTPPFISNVPSGSLNSIRQDMQGAHLSRRTMQRPRRRGDGRDISHSTANTSVRQESSSARTRSSHRWNMQGAHLASGTMRQSRIWGRDARNTPHSAMVIPTGATSSSAHPQMHSHPRSDSFQ